MDRGASLGEAIDWLRDRVEDGAECPCCTQFAKVYRRRVSCGMVLGLTQFYRAHGLDWGHQPSVPGMARMGGEWARLTYWGMIEEELEKREDGGRAGWWRITQAGLDFLNGSRVPKYARVYDGRVLGLVGDPWSAQDALGAKFDLRELMAGG